MSSGSAKLEFRSRDEDYGSAARRHLRDAHALLAQEREDNAAYLAGYVLECSLKRLLEIHHDQGPKGYGHDLQTLSGRALVLAALLSPAATRYRIDDLEVLPEMVAFWTPNQRYFRTGAVVNGRLMVEGAEAVYERILVEAILDGRGALNP